jgi:hypothetical protein
MRRRVENDIEEDIKNLKDLTTLRKEFEIEKKVKK